MTRTCLVSGVSFDVSKDDVALLERLSPRVGATRLLLPAPRLSPDERKRRRLAFRNERNLYHRQCALTGVPIVSLYSPDKDLAVYSKAAWWSDGWDFRDFGRDFDFSRPFFEQFAELFRAAPKCALITSPDADENNCPYINFAGNSLNCHMIFDSDFDEDCYYSNVLKHSRNCSDCSYVHSGELCYECIDCTSCYELLYSQNCSGCRNSGFLYACVGCSDCFLCSNLVQQRYCFRNRQYSKEEYFALVSEARRENRQSVTTLFAELENLVAAAPKKHCRIVNGESCSGDYIVDSRNIHCSFNIGKSEDLRYCDSVYEATSCMDVSSFGEQISHVYESGTVGIHVTDTLFSFCVVLSCANLIYCTEARISKHCFGCASVKNAEYCILNKQYSREDYERLVPRIVRHMEDTGEWGEYFPISMSPFGYNETVAQTVFPLDESGARSLGASWSSYSPPPPTARTVDGTALGDSIHDAPADILETAVRCAVSGRPFRITKPELALYRTLGVPLPALHPDLRHERRMRARNPQRLWTSQCAATGEPITTSFDPATEKNVYGEKAFLDLVYS